jgi:tetratricopeptide (TPR) repeat protein
MRIAFGLLLAPAIAVAAEAEPTLGPEAPPAADQRYRIGRQLYRDGRFADAAAEFRAALAMFPKSAKLAFNLARSLERAGDLAGAIEHYRLYTKLDPQAGDRAEIEALIPTLRARLEASWPSVAIVTRPGGARILVDGEARPETTPATLRLPPGPHTVRLQLDGHETADRLVDLSAGAPAALDVALAPAAPVAVASTPPPEPDWRTWTGYGALALGVAAAGVGVLGHVQSSDTADEAAAVRPGPEGEARYRRLQDDYDSQRLMMGVGYGLGAAFVAAGVALLVWPSDEPGDAASLTIRF